MGRRRRVFVVGVLVALGALLALSSVAGAARAAGTGGRRADASTTSSTTPTSVGIGGDYAYSGAVVHEPGTTKTRTLNAYQSAVFVQSWLGDLYYGHPKFGPPSANLTVSRVDVTGNWGGTYTTLAVYYATDGSQVWIGFPHQPITTTPSSRPPAPGGWFIAPARVRQAYAGTAKLVLTGGVQAATSTSAPPVTSSTSTAPPAASAGGHRSRRSIFLWIGLGLALVAALWTVVSVLRERGAKKH